MVARAVAESESRIRVELVDGRVQLVELTGLQSADGKTTVKLTEVDAKGAPLRSESTEEPSVSK